MSSDALNDLISNPGVLAAMDFSTDGTLTDHALGRRSRLNKLTEESLDLLAHMCAANMCTATMQARGWESVTGLSGFEPVDVVTLVGFELSVSVVPALDRESSRIAGYRGIVYRNEGADFEAAARLLRGA